jgi:hypothetical protein
VHILKTESADGKLKDFFMDIVPKSTVGMQNGQTHHFIQQIKSDPC